MYVPTRKHCTGCRRWRVTCTDFHVAEWRDGCAYRLQSRCVSCQRAGARVRAGRRRREAGTPVRRRTPVTSARARRQLARRRRLYKHGQLLPIGPFRIWLNQMIMENSIGGVAAQLRADPSFVTRMWQGQEWYDGRWRPKKRVTTVLVDKWMSAFGQSMNEIYPMDDE